MKRDCPHCGARLGLEVGLHHCKPPPGERGFLPGLGVPCCPFCEKPLYRNRHPAELWMPIAGLPLLLVVLGRFALGDRFSASAWTTAFIVSALFFIGAVAYAHFRHLREWPEFSREPTRRLLFRRGRK